MWKEQRVAVVIPAFEEERLLGHTLATVPDFVDCIVVVDDGSRDGTWKRLEELRDGRVIAVRHAKNRGVGAAIVTGYLYALRCAADVVVVMAGDNQMLPGDMPQLLDAVIQDGADYAKGNRLLHPEAHAMPALRRLGSRFLSWLTRRATGLSVRDCQCGYTALRAETARRLPLAELWPRYGYPNDLLALLSRIGARVVDVPVTPVYGDESSGLHAGHVLGIALRILRRGRQRRVIAHGDVERSSTGTSRPAS